MPARMAEMALMSLGENATLPLDVESLIRSYGIEIERAPLTKAICGIYYPLKIQPVIVINSLLDFRRARFTLAHELFHHLDFVTNGTRRNPRFLMPDGAKERAANTFAGSLLMPEKAIQFLSQVKTQTELCDIFGVSRQALEIRLRETAS